MIEDRFWFDVRPYVRACKTVRSLSHDIPPRERWRRAFRLQRRIQRMWWRRIIRAGTIGTIYGVRVVRSNGL